MYYYAGDIEEVFCGRIRPRLEKDSLLETAYRWLGRHCGFFPPLWVSRNQNKLVGYNIESQKVLFGFKRMNGFGVIYDEWITLVGILANLKTSSFYYVDQVLFEELQILEKDGMVDFEGTKNLREYLQKKVFKKSDQIIVQSLDLRRSDIIICKSKIQKAALIKKGFPASKIKIKKVYSHVAQR